jgi:hypothetical protein
MGNDLINNVFKGLRLTFKQALSNGNSYDDFNFNSFIIEPQIKIMIEEIEKLPKTDYLKVHIELWIEYIDEIIFITKFERNKKAYKELKLALVNYLTILLPKIETELLSNSNVKKDQSNKKRYKKNEMYFTEPETILIIRYLQKNMLFIPNIDDTDMMRAFHILTGFSDEKLRQNNCETKNKIEELIKSKESFDKVIHLFNESALQIGQIKREINNSK